MADSFLFDIAHTILGKLGSLALQQFSMVFCVKNDLDKLQKTLLTIKDVLLDAEEQQAKNDELANWVEELKEVLYDADDFLDEIEVNGLRGQLLFRNIKGKVTFDRSKLAASIVSCATNKPCNESLTFNEVITCLQDSLRGKRFLLILDDVWNEDRPKWLEFRSWLCGGGGGSKVIVTTRNEYVASVMESTYTHKLNSLPDNDCLSLFVKWAFRDGQEKHHPNLVKIGEDIVKKCKGVPLAIRTLGCMLFMKTDESDWLSVRDNEIWLLEQKEDDILPALRLSYNQLPCYLKQCFAYYSMFPKGQDIASIMLIQLWMAQGLIQSCSENEELEDMGTRHVKELCSRSLLEEVEAYGSFITFKMHDLVHDLAVSVAQNERSVPYKNFGNSTEKMRHISLHNYKKESTVAIGGVISRFKYLRVFDLSHSHLEEVPLSIGDLKHLRYLDLSGNNIKSLPTTICRLQNLQTLRLVLCTQLLKIPRGIKYLISLRHLYITTRETSFLEKGIGCLTTLQSLSILRCENLTSLFEGAEKLINLRTLVIGDCPRLTSLPGGMKFLTALENLMIINCEELNFSDWQDFQGFTSLRSLMIGGLPRLGDLPQFASTNSNKLEFLEIIGCPKLTSLPDILICLGGLMVLKIDKCPELSRRCEKELGEDWSKISHVQEIYLNGIKL
ncbi:unnamed protein product [Coffea canephora]|uniref:PH domain-containing protein n=1 Tax=Coffea canephora TaxID=49390 RepID=A0A068VHT0_COFCA|nr:unnamed protein product [Coffea canephora]